MPNANETVKVYFELYIAQLIKIDEVSQIMETKLWLKQRWNDYKLRWNFSEYDKIRNIRVPSDDIWKPDIVLYNTAMGDFHVKQNTKAVVSYDGEVTWMPPAILKSSCSIDVTYFPFDAQNCTMKFGAWTHGKSRIDLKMVRNMANQDEFWESGEWEILDAKGVKVRQTYYGNIIASSFFLCSTRENTIAAPRFSPILSTRFTFDGCPCFTQST